MRVALIAIAWAPSFVAAQDSARVVPSRHKSAVREVALSADGRRVASAADSTVIVWDRASGDSVAAFRVPSVITGISFSPDGNRIGVKAFGAAILADLNANLSQISLQGSAGALAFSPSGKVIAVAAANDRTVWIVDAATLRVTSTLRGHGGERIQFVRFDATGDRLLVISGSPDQDFLRLWDARTWRSVWNVRTTVAVDARFTANDSIIVAERSPGPRRRSLIVTRSASSGAALDTLEMPASMDQLSPDARIGLTLESDVTLVDLSSGAKTRTLAVAPSYCGGAQYTGHSRSEYSSDGRWVATWSEFAGFTVWNAKTGERALAVEHVAPPKAPVFEWTFAQSTQLAPDPSTQERFVLVELDLRNVTNERQDVEGKWDSSACLWIDDKPHRASPRSRIMLDLATADSVSQRLRSSLKAGETMNLELNLAPGVTVSRRLARTEFETSRWSWYLDPGKAIRVGFRFPASVPRSGSADLESTGARKRVTLPPPS